MLFCCQFDAKNYNPIFILDDINELRPNQSFIGDENEKSNNSFIIDQSCCSIVYLYGRITGRDGISIIRPNVINSQEMILVNFAMCISKDCASINNPVQYITKNKIQYNSHVVINHVYLVIFDLDIKCATITDIEP